MKVLHSGAGYVVVDDFLNSGAMAEVWGYIQNEAYVSVFSELSGFLAGEESSQAHGAINAANKVWRLSDGAPLRGTPVEFGEARRSRVPSPTGLSLDHLLREISAAAGEFPNCVGVQGVDWQRFNAVPMLYPVGAGLSWHSDGEDRTGAFVYYAHPTWNVQWGGELLIADLSPSRVHHAYAESKTSPWLDNSLENELLMEIGTGTFIQSKPNRLVLLGGGVHHAIAPVRPAAGDRVRCSISGFFIRGADT